MRFKLHALIAVLLLTGCGDSTTAPPTPPTPVATSITLSPTSLLFASLGVSQQLSATVKDQNGATMSGVRVYWSSSAESVAGVSAGGNVTAVSEGTATILAFIGSGSVRATATVTVAQVAEALSLSDSALTFGSLADTTQLTATVTDANGEVIDGASVTWATSAASVATVSSTGLVTSVADGSATITATSGLLTATANVTVARRFYLAANGVTILCSAADVGESGDVGGVTYTKRSRSQITTGNAVTTCTSDIPDMSTMFYNEATFNEDISSWDVSSVTDMRWMFYNAEAFNQDLSDWCVSNITTKPKEFDIGATSWVLPRPVWGTCP